MAFLAAGEVNTAMWSVCFRQEDCGSLMCDFRVSQQADDCSLTSRLSPHNAPSSKGKEGPALVHCLKQRKAFLQSETTLLSDFWEDEGSLKLTECAEREGPDGRKRKVAAAERKHMISPQIFPFLQRGDGQRCFEGRSQSSYLVDSIFAPTLHLCNACVTVKCEKGFGVIGSWGDLQREAVVTGCSTYISYRMT